MKKKYILDGFFAVYYIRIPHMALGYITQNKKKTKVEKEVVKSSCFKDAVKIKKLEIPRGFYFAFAHNKVINRLNRLNDKETKIVKQKFMGKVNINGLKKFIKTDKCKSCNNDMCSAFFDKKEDNTDEYFIVIQQKV